MEFTRFSKLDTTAFINDETKCLAIINTDDDDAEDYLIASLDPSEFEKLEAEHPKLYFSEGSWWERAFWFDDENHCATVAIPNEVAQKYLDEEEYKDERAYADDLIDDCTWRDDDFYQTHITLSLGQINSHPWAFTEIGEDELLAFWGYDPNMLNEGAFYQGWCDG